MRKFGIVLAAGQGTRMKSKLYKVLHPVCGKAMVDHVITTLEQSDIQKIVTIIGHGAETLQALLGERTDYAYQEEQLGTGHAVLQAEKTLRNEEGTTVVICGDTPLLTPNSIQQMIAFHEEKQSAATIMTADLEDPKGYGRIIRNAKGRVLKIVEQKDCSDTENQINEINTGTYCFDNQKLFRALSMLTNDNAQGEYYLTDVISILKDQAEEIEGFRLKDPDEAIGVNDRVALAMAEQRMRERVTRYHMDQGVTIIDPHHTYIGLDVEIGMDTVVHPGTQIMGKTQIGEGCVIGAQSEIKDAVIGNNVHIKRSVIDKATIGDECNIGPFAFIRPQTVLDSGVKVGDFVEIKNSTIGEGSKVPHLSYVGDSQVGKHVNIGCGVITCNYNGFTKHRTVIEDDAFIGSNVNLIAPIHIGNGAYVVAGSTITENVEQDSLAIARKRQTNKEGYAEKLKKRFQREKNKEQ